MINTGKYNITTIDKYCYHGQHLCRTDSKKFSDCHGYPASAWQSLGKKSWLSVLLSFHYTFPLTQTSVCPITGNVPGKLGWVDQPAINPYVIVPSILYFCWINFCHKFHFLIARIPLNILNQVLTIGFVGSMTQLIKELCGSLRPRDYFQGIFKKRNI